MKETEWVVTYLKNEWALNLNDQSTMDEIRLVLAEQIRQLIDRDFSQLVQLLYRVDISEKKLKQVLHEQVNEDAAQLIAGLIIERQFQKIQTRKFFRRDYRDSEEERW